MTKSRGNRGKSLEGDVRAYLNDKKQNDKTFMFYRLPDARSCGGGLKAQPGDYFVFRQGKNSIVLDPKELKTGMRINIKSRLSQSAKMNRLRMAGVHGYFLIHQTTEDLYFVVTITEINKEKAKGNKSIDLKKWNPYDFERAMEVVCLDLFG